MASKEKRDCDQRPRGQKLMPCPFCGGAQLLIGRGRDDEEWLYALRCKHCGIQGPLSRDEYGAVIEWNRRDHIGGCAEIVSTNFRLEYNYGGAADQAERPWIFPPRAERG